jgi:hypothetical protein
MKAFFHDLSPVKRLGAFTVVAVVMSVLSFAILWLEYGVFNLVIVICRRISQTRRLSELAMQFGIQSRLVPGCSGYM